MSFSLPCITVRPLPDSRQARATIKAEKEAGKIFPTPREEDAKAIKDFAEVTAKTSDEIPREITMGLCPIVTVAQRVGFIACRPIHMMVEAGSRPVSGNICVQAGGGLEPVVEVMARRTTALLVEDEKRNR